MIPLPCPGDEAAAAAGLHCPGDIIPHTGLYDAIHTDEEPGTELFLAGQEFPECLGCGGSVRYRLQRVAPYIFEDEDFRRES